MPNIPKMLTAAEVAAQLSVDPRTVKRMCLRGDFPNFQRLGASDKSPYLIPETDLIAYKKKLASPPGGGKAS